jgi:hypothetical protein
MVEEQDIVTQQRMQLEDFRCDEFFHKVLVDYDFLWAYPYFCEKRDRIVCYGMYSENHVTDDAIHQLLVKDVLVALVYERRTDMNFIEATYVIVAKGIRLARHRLKNDYRSMKHDKNLKDRVRNENKDI